MDEINKIDIKNTYEEFNTFDTGIKYDNSVKEVNDYTIKHKASSKLKKLIVSVAATITLLTGVSSVSAKTSSIDGSLTVLDTTSSSITVKYNINETKKNLCIVLYNDFTNRKVNLDELNGIFTFANLKDDMKYTVCVSYKSTIYNVKDLKQSVYTRG